MNHDIHQPITTRDISAVAGDDRPIPHAMCLRKSLEGSEITTAHEKNREIVDLGAQVMSSRKKIGMTLAFEKSRYITDHEATFQAQLGSKVSHGARVGDQVVEFESLMDHVHLRQVDRLRFHQSTPHRFREAKHSVSALRAETVSENMPPRTDELHQVGVMAGENHRASRNPRSRHPNETGLKQVSLNHVHPLLMNHFRKPGCSYG